MNSPSLLEANSKFEFTFSNVTNHYDKNPKCSTLPWGKFCKEFSSPDRSRGELTFQEYHYLHPQSISGKQKRSKEKDGPGWLSITFKTSNGRTNENVDKLTGLVLDIDTGGITQEFIERALQGVEFFAHTTYSHKPDSPKWRVIIPFTTVIYPQRIESIFDHFNKLFSGALDKCGKKPSQMYYSPSCPFDAPFESFRNAGKFFDPSKFNPDPPQPTTYKIPTSPKLPTASSNQITIPKPCQDGERHEVGLSYIAKLIDKNLSYEEVLENSRKWNAQNIPPWPDEVLKSKVDGMFNTDKRHHPDRYEPKPWENIKIPAGFDLNWKGVFLVPYEDKKPEILISSPCWVSGKTRDIDGNSWGVQVEWKDSDKRLHKQAIPKERFHETGNKLAQDLAYQGLDIVPGNEKSLLRYLGLFDPQNKLFSVSKLGWLDKPNGKLTYVLPNKVFSSERDDKFVFQPEKHSPSSITIKSQGTLEDWQSNISYLAQNHPYLIFCLCVSFAGPLLKPAGLEGGGFHLYGRSSHGKTTAAQLAASVWGCGADPSEAPKQAYVRKWNTTHNGLEALAAAHNDGILILDEAGTCNAKNFGKVIYDITGGQGKVSLNSDRGIRESRSWHILILSTGEISAQQKIEEEGNRALAGHILRLMDIPIHEGIFNPNNRRTGGQLALDIKRGCANYYGTAGPAYLDQLIKQFKNFPQLRRIIKEEFERANTDLKMKGLEPEKVRALQRLALAMVAGKLAVEFDILPFEPEEITDSVIFVRDVWIRNQDNQSPSMKGLNAIKEFIIRNHQSRFGDANGSQSSQVRDLAGYIDKSENLYLFTEDGFKEACRGLNTKEVLEDLRKKGFLHINEGNRMKIKKQIPGLGRTRFYAVKEEILEGEE